MYIDIYIYMYIDIYVYVYICMCMSMCMCMCMRMCMCMCIQEDLHIYMRFHVYVYVYLPVYFGSWPPTLYIYTDISICIYIYLYNINNEVLHTERIIWAWVVHCNVQTSTPQRQHHRHTTHKKVIRQYSAMWHSLTSHIRRFDYGRDQAQAGDTLELLFRLILT